MPRQIAYSHPAIRGYFTYAWWDDDFVGSVGTPSFRDDSEGLAAGGPGRSLVVERR
jgi:hypothetical protein